MHFHVVKGKFKKKRLFKKCFDYFIVLLNSKKVNVIAKVHVSVIVKTVFPDASPVYPDGTDLPPTTVKNVEYI